MVAASEFGSGQTHFLKFFRWGRACPHLAVVEATVATLATVEMAALTVAQATSLATVRKAVSTTARMATMAVV